jgi:hypothetical protein
MRWDALLNEHFDLLEKLDSDGRKPPATHS